MEAPLKKLKALLYLPDLEEQWWCRSGCRACCITSYTGPRTFWKYSSYHIELALPPIYQIRIVLKDRNVCPAPTASINQPSS